MCHVLHVTCQLSLSPVIWHYYLQTVIARVMNFFLQVSSPPVCQVPGVKCNMSYGVFHLTGTPSLLERGNQLNETPCILHATFRVPDDTITSKLWKLGPWNFETIFTNLFESGFTCHVSNVICHMLTVPCQLSTVAWHHYSQTVRARDLK